MRLGGNKHNYDSSSASDLPQSQAPPLYPNNSSGGSFLTGNPSTTTQGYSAGGGSNDDGNDSGDGTHSTNNGGNSGGDGGKDNEARRPPYTMHGVLHYLQHEWSRYELERAQWEMERAELRARISFLVGERKGQENLKHDLVRRIKMLEYSLKQERAKIHRLQHNGQDPEQDEMDSDFNPGGDSNVPMDIDALEKGISGDQKAANNQDWRQARQVLRQYLQEIGYSEKILDVRSFRVKNLLGLLPDNWNLNGDGRKAAEKALLDTEQAVLETADIIKQSRKYDNFNDSNKNNSSGDFMAGDDDSDSDNDVDNKQSSLDVDAVEALDEFSFLKNEKSYSGTASQNPPKACQEEFRHRMEDRKRASAGGKGQRSMQDESDEGGGPGTALDALLAGGIGGVLAAGGAGGVKSLDVDTALGFSPDDGPIDTKDDFGSMVDDDQLLANQQRWNIRFTLRSHYDSIRAMQFHPMEPVLVTASEDGTAKLWDLSGSHAGGTIKSNSGDGAAGLSKAAQNPPSTGIVDVEPIYTFRGHKGPILAMDMSPTGDMCYTGGHDGSICCWVVPSTAIEVYQNYDPTVLQERLLGHTDCVWAVAFHSSTNRLISASADGTVRFNARPRSIDIVSTEPQQLLIAYSKAQCSILDLETGQNVLNFDFQDGGDGDGVGEINKILSHPTMPITVVAGEDRKIRYFDNNTGKLIHGTVAHVEAISTLAIDPNGLYLLSGSHDGSLRLWNMEKSQGVCNHPTMPSLLPPSAPSSVVQTSSTSSTTTVSSPPTTTSSGKE
uniref:Striatin N-terminal domain-containing protein n=1 Tax=Ditylenchus dipsaci TaxID=166011 RepID=A0A915E510_9BILA